MNIFRNAVLLFTIFVQACVLVNPNGGSNHGNPRAAEAPKTADIMRALCGKTDQCLSGFPDSNCFEGLRFLAAGNLGSGTFNELMQKERDGLISADTQRTAACSAALSNLACSTTQMGEAWSASDPDDFSGLSGLLPAECSEVFTD
jgi:hypothetical protein